MATSAHEGRPDYIRNNSGANAVKTGQRSQQRCNSGTSAGS